MKNLILLLFPCLLLLCACGKEEATTESLDFVVINDISNPAGGNFMFLSNQFGEILYDTIGENLFNTVQLSVKSTDQVDVTYGFQYEGLFQVWTYRDVESGFKTDSYDRACELPIQSYPSTASFRRLTIDGLSFQPSEVYFPVYNPYLNISVFNEQMNINGYDDNKTDFLITIANTDGTYRSKLVLHEEWAIDTIGELREWVHFDEFVPATVHSIEIPTDASWELEATALSSTGRIVKLAKRQSNNQDLPSNQIKLFSIEELDIDRILLDITFDIDGKQYHHFKWYDDFPSSINLYEPSIEVLNLSRQNKSYELLVTQNPDMIKSQIKYDNSFEDVNTWTVFQKRASGFSYRLPAIPASISDDLLLIKEALPNPKTFRVEAIKARNSVEFIKLYNQSTINNQYGCFEFETKEERFSF